MKFPVSICSLLVGANLAFIASSVNAIRADDAEDEYFNDDNETMTEEDRWQREIEDFPRGLKVSTDGGELVELTIENRFLRGTMDEDIRQQVLFQLYTRRNPTNYQQLGINSHGDLLKSYFDGHKPTVFITHGWLVNGRGQPCTLIRDAYLKNADVNVIIVDWAAVSILPYISSAKQTVSIGKQVARMIEYLSTFAHLNPDELTLVGHSMGAHIMGIAGYHANVTVNIIFGLDPAYPMFKYATRGSRISRYDARHVQIIHTNAGLLGHPKPLGHTDFYPNGGMFQRGCLLNILEILTCSHGRAFKYFAESLNTQLGFVARECRSNEDYKHGRCTGQNITFMGGRYIDFYRRGIFYLPTNSIEPYARGSIY